MIDSQFDAPADGACTRARELRINHLSGDVVVVRYRSIDGAFRAARPLTVVEDGDDWLVTYLHPGATVAVPVLADGRALRDVPLEERWAHPRATALRPWVGGDLVILFPREREFSLWL